MLCPSSIQHRNSNLQPSEHESPHITTRAESLSRQRFFRSKTSFDLAVIHRVLPLAKCLVLLVVPQFFADYNVTYTEKEKFLFLTGSLVRLET